MLFALHPLTGEPANDVRELAVPQNAIPGEQTAITQPFSGEHAIVHGRTLSSDSIFGINERDRQECLARFRNANFQGQFTPPALDRETLVWPGLWGGPNWDGGAWDHKRGLLFMLVRRLAFTVTLSAGSKGHRRAGRTPPGSESYNVLDGDFTVTRAPFVAASGIPCTAPPWSVLVAVSPLSGRVTWTAPVGISKLLPRRLRDQPWGSLAFGGPLATESGLVFIAAGEDDRIRAFDSNRGTLIWEHRLPAGGQAAPMTYVFRGRQYLVIVAGGRAGVGSPGDWIVAFALPD